MTPEIKQAMETRLAELEPVQESLWAAYKQAEDDMRPQTLRMESARAEWSKAWEELQWIKRRLGKEA